MTAPASTVKVTPRMVEAGLACLASVYPSAKDLNPQARNALVGGIFTSMLEADGDVGLTPQLRELLVFMSNCFKQNGWMPSYDEAAAALGLQSKSGIHRMLGVLEARGYVRRGRGHRSLTILRAPTDG